MNNVAYAERDLKFIKKRSRIHFLYRAFRKVYSRLLKYENRQIKTVLLYPTIKEESDLANILNRIAWAIPYREDIKIFIPVEKTLRNLSIKSLTPPESQMSYLNKSCLDHIFIISERDIRKYFKSDALLIHKWKSILARNIIIRLYKTFIVDEDFFDGVEAHSYQNFCYNTLSENEKKELERISKENFQRLVEINNGKEIAYCFASGPSFDKYRDFSYEENSFKVICNTIVKNEEFLEFLKKPDLLVFMDPAYYCGPSKYANAFRECAKNVIEKYDCFVMVSETLAPLILYHYPQWGKNIIGMRRTGKTFNFPTVEKFRTCIMCGNILTFLMIPVASSISKEIYILGADGRRPDENYFWTHSKSAQFSDLMETVFNTHPSFVRDIDYQDFYEKQCESFEDLCRYGESLGKHYISLTQSYIPALKRRQKIGNVKENDEIKTKT